MPNEITKTSVFGALYDIKEKRDIGYNSITSLTNLDGSKNKVVATLTGATTLSFDSAKPMNIGSTMYISCNPANSFSQNLNGEGIYAVREELNVKKGSPFTIKITCFGKNQYFVSTYAEDKPYADITFNVTPSDAIIKVNGQVLTDNIYTGATDKEIKWEVSKSGMNTQQGVISVPITPQTVTVKLDNYKPIKPLSEVIPGDCFMKSGAFVSISDINEDNAFDVIGIVASDKFNDEYGNQQFFILRYIDELAQPGNRFFMQRPILFNRDTKEAKTLGYIEYFNNKNGVTKFYCNSPEGKFGLDVDVSDSYICADYVDSQYAQHEGAGSLIMKSDWDENNGSRKLFAMLSNVHNVIGPPRLATHWEQVLSSYAAVQTAKHVPTFDAPLDLITCAKGAVTDTLMGYNVGPEFYEFNFKYNDPATINTGFHTFMLCRMGNYKKIVLDTEISTEVGSNGYWDYVFRFTPIKFDQSVNIPGYISIAMDGLTSYPSGNVVLRLSPDEFSKLKQGETITHRENYNGTSKPSTAVRPYNYIHSEKYGASNPVDIVIRSRGFDPNNSDGGDYYPAIEFNFTGGSGNYYAWVENQRHGVTSHAYNVHNGSKFNVTPQGSVYQFLSGQGIDLNVDVKTQDRAIPIYARKAVGFTGTGTKVGEINPKRQFSVNIDLSKVP